MKNNRVCVLLGGMLVVSTSTAVFAVEVPEVTGPAFKIKAGEVWKSKRLRNGEEIIVEATRLDEKTQQLSRSNGCITTNSTEDRYGPNLSWEKCNDSRKWHSGEVTKFDREGALWPFKVGNKVKYKYARRNAEGKMFYGTKMSCEVAAKETVEVPAGEFGTYRVDCKYPWAKQSYWYAPALDRTVKFEQDHRKRGKVTSELIEVIQ
ncbi:MAG: hypothetical protein QNJ91_00575 [Gammaproteobacteria bacterium]|nr:hypothetical protein [Gammaproteobacteria bacterium]